MCTDPCKLIAVWAEIRTLGNYVQGSQELCSSLRTLEKRLQLRLWEVESRRLPWAPSGIKESCRAELCGGRYFRMPVGSLKAAISGCHLSWVTLFSADVGVKDRPLNFCFLPFFKITFSFLWGAHHGVHVKSEDRFHLVRSLHHVDFGD